MSDREKELEQNYIDLICEFAQSTNDAADRVISIEHTKTILRNLLLLSNDPDELKEGIKTALTELNSFE